jgi:hypothetical protein
MKAIINKSAFRFWLVIALAAAFSLTAYVLPACLEYQCGFPLDDAWIHQTYARNLSRLGEWSYLPGRPSAGSTSPLWTVLLFVGYQLGLNPLVWTYFLGWVVLVGIAYIFYRGILLANPEIGGLALLGSGLVVFEWHLVWAAGSGMETLLAAASGLCMAALLLSPSKAWIWMGVVTGLSAWVRPEGITWAFAVLWVVYFSQPDWGDRLKAVLKFISMVCLVVAPYLIFNYQISGNLLPSTYFAKQAEYAVLQNVPFWVRLIQQAELPLVGVGVLLLPGFIIFIHDTWTRRNWNAMALVFWCCGYVVMYAWRLPVTYQHGRYLIPMMPVYFLCGFIGITRISIANSSRRWQWIMVRAWVISAVFLLVVFWGLGLNAYYRDVAFIQTEMVNVAKWVAQNTPTQARVAAHDIGALGYFGNRELFDLAGLISPQIIPYLRDETKIREFLDDEHVDYLVTFPGWYPELTGDLTAIYISGGDVSVSLGGENMAVYFWQEMAK